MIHSHKNNCLRALYVCLCVTLWSACPLSAATVDGVPIHSSTAGQGPATLIFVHGWTCDETSWGAQVSSLSESYRVVTLDLPGHGKSGAPRDGAFSMDLFARAVEAVREDVGAGKVVLIGHSMGVPVIRQYARRYPQHVAGLVAVDGPISVSAIAALTGNPDGEFPSLPEVSGPGGLQVRESMIRGMFTPATPVALQEQILAMMLAAPEATAVGAMAAMGDPELWQDDPIPMPVLAVYAGTAQVPDAQMMMRTVPSYASAQLAGTGHFLMMEKPEEFNSLLSDFLGRIEF